MYHKKLLQETCEKMGIPLSEEMADRFMTYLSLLLEWNKKMNLTAITEEKDVVQKHFADCLSILPHLQLAEHPRVLDVGTGAGFPGIPLKIACPSLDITLLDSLQKRLSFLEEVTDTLSLSDVSFVHARAEDSGQNPLYREQFDLVVSRAVAHLSVLGEYCLPFLQVGGILAALKGPDVKTELAESTHALAVLGGRIQNVIDIEIPFTDLEHKLVLIEKTIPTPKQYPRKAGKVTKNPL